MSSITNNPLSQGYPRSGSVTEPYGEGMLLPESVKNAAEEMIGLVSVTRDV